ncbi:MAG: hypothetical protein WB392_02120 [Methanotrichaceae archaeon]
MKYIKFLMALAVACILIMPAFSMPNNVQNDKQNQWDGQKPMMQDGQQNQCNCQNSMGQDNDKQSKWDGKEKDQCGCQNSIKSMMGNDDKQKGQCGCENSMGQNGKQMSNRPIKSMMGKMGQFGGQMCHRPIKSMMGNHGGIKAIIVIVKIIE